MRQGVNALADPAEHVKHKPTALSTNSPPSRITAHKQMPGPHASQEIHSCLCKQPAKVQRTCASRNGTKEQDPGTFRGKAWLQTAWADRAGLWRKGGAHPSPLCSKAAIALRGWKPEHQLKERKKLFFMEVRSMHRRGKKTVRWMKMYQVRYRVFVPPPVEVFIFPRTARGWSGIHQACLGMGL